MFHPRAQDRPFADMAALVGELLKRAPEATQQLHRPHPAREDGLAFQGVVEASAAAQSFHPGYLKRHRPVILHVAIEGRC